MGTEILRRLRMTVCRVILNAVKDLCHEGAEGTEILRKLRMTVGQNDRRLRVTDGPCALGMMNRC